MMPRCVAHLGGEWTVRKDGYRYHLKREDVKVKLNFGMWGSVPRSAGKVKATLETGAIKLTGDLDSIRWALALLP